MLARLILFFPILMTCAAAQPSGQIGVVARISSSPPVNIAEVEASVQANPANVPARIVALTHYSEFAAAANPAFRTSRLRHILYLVDTQPADRVTASALAYVYSTAGPYADAGDHETVRNAWLRAADANPANDAIQINASRFLYREHPEEAEDLLRRALNRTPASRSIAANLGFMYATDILGISTPGITRTSLERDRLRARDELDRTTNALVLAAAGTALPNVYMRTAAAHNANPDRTVFELSAALLAKARQMAPNDTELHGPMPLIHEFERFREQEIQGSPQTRAAVSSLPDEGTVRTGEEVQAGKLIEKPEPVYPPLAMQARIQGVVRFNAVIAAHGSIENLTLVSGHPLLVPAATEVARSYRYQSTLLHGQPVKVITQISVPFTLTK